MSQKKGFGDLNAKLVRTTLQLECSDASMHISTMMEIATCLQMSFKVQGSCLEALEIAERTPGLVQQRHKDLTSTIRTGSPQVWSSIVKQGQNLQHVHKTVCSSRRPNGYH
eukprot:324064-Amphidinium_carterae.1